MNRFISALLGQRKYQDDEADVHEFLAKTRGLGISPKEALNTALKFAAVGANEAETSLFAKLSAKRTIVTQDLVHLADLGYSVDLAIKLRKTDLLS